MRRDRPRADHRMYQLSDERMAKYNCIDIRATADAGNALVSEAIERGMYEFFQARVMPLTAPVMDMQKRGLRLDTHRQAQLRYSFRDQLAEVDAEIISFDKTGRLARPTDKSPNSLNSTKALEWFLYDHLALLPTRRTKSQKSWSTDQTALLGVLQSLRKKDEHARPVLYNLLHRTKLDTILTRYLGLYPDLDGQVRPVIKMNGTETGRFAYDNPALQQYPDEVRSIFLPRPGFVFLGGDYEQVEARISAFLTNDLIDLRIFAEGLDIHAETAKALFSYTDEEWVDLDPALVKAARNYAKTFRYGLLYGGAPETLRMKTYCPCPRCEAKLPPTLGLPRLKIVEASQRWLSQHSCLLQWRSKMELCIKHDRSITNPLGRKRYFFEPWPRCKRAAWNYPIQSTAADIINGAMLDLWKKYKAPFYLQMHDYLGVEIPEKEADLWQGRLREVMEATIPEMGGMTFPVELKAERPWGTVVTGSAGDS